MATTPEEDQATAIGNMRQKFSKDPSRNIFADRQTDRPTHTHTYRGLSNQHISLKL